MTDTFDIEYTGATLWILLILAGTCLVMAGAGC